MQDTLYECVGNYAAMVMAYYCNKVGNIWWIELLPTISIRGHEIWQTGLDMNMRNTFFNVSGTMLPW